MYCLNDTLYVYCLPCLFILSHCSTVNQISILFLIFVYGKVNKLRGIRIEIYYATSRQDLKTDISFFTNTAVRA